MADHIIVPLEVFKDGAFGRPEPYSKREAFLDLVQMAACEDRESTINGAKYKEHRGQLVISKSILCKKWGWNIDKVRRYLDYLQRNHWCHYSCDHQSYQPITLLSIVNYDSYHSSATTNTTTNTTSGATTPATNVTQKTSTVGSGNKAKSTSGKAGDEPLKFPFTSERFMKGWSMLIQQPKWKGKTKHALQLNLNDLGKYDERFAYILMADAIKNNWQGIVFDSTPERYERWKKEHMNQSPQQAAEPQPKTVSYSELRAFYKTEGMSEEQWRGELKLIIEAKHRDGLIVINDEN